MPNNNASDLVRPTTNILLRQLLDMISPTVPKWCMAEATAVIGNGSGTQRHRSRHGTSRKYAKASQRQTRRWVSIGLTKTMKISCSVVEYMSAPSYTCILLGVLQLTNTSQIRYTIQTAMYCNYVANLCHLSTVATGKVCTLMTRCKATFSTFQWQFSPSAPCSVVCSLCHRPVGWSQSKASQSGRELRCDATFIKSVFETGAKCRYNRFRQWVPEVNNPVLKKFCFHKGPSVMFL